MDEKNIQELMLIYEMKTMEELVALSENAESPIERGIAVKIINERKRQQYIDSTKGIQTFFCVMTVLGIISVFITMMSMNY